MNVPQHNTGAFMLAVAVVIATIMAQGCTRSQIQIQAEAAAVTAAVHSAGGAIVDERRAAALAEIEDTTMGQPVDERLSALRSERTRWQPVGLALDSARRSLLLWLDSLDVAVAADAGDDVAGSLLTLGAQVLLAWGEVVRVAAELGAELPALPEWVVSLIQTRAGAE